MEKLTTKKGGKALYIQIKDIYRDKILSGELKLGDKIESEMEIQQKYNVSRITARQAILDLEKEGMVKRGRGKGTFVIWQPAIEEELSHIMSFTKEMEHRNRVPGTKGLSVSIEPLPEGFGSHSKEKMYCIERMCFMNNKYKVVITANKDVASVISEDVIGANLDTYNNYESYSVKLTKVGDFEKTEGIVYNTYNVKYNGKGDDYTVYVRNGAQFPTIKNPTLADGETLVGWYYEVEEEKVGLGYEVVLEASNVTYDLNYEVITASSTTNDPRKFWIKGDSTATLDGTTVSWTNQTHYLKQTSAYTYEGTLVVNGAFNFQIVSDLYGVNQAIYYRTGAVENPGDFIDKTSLANIKITESGTYKLVFNSLTGKVTITVAE